MNPGQNYSVLHNTYFVISSLFCSASLQVQRMVIILTAIGQIFPKTDICLSWINPQFLMFPEIQHKFQHLKDFKPVSELWKFNKQK